MAEFPMKTEVVVIGAGVAGIMTAWHLAKKGIPVVVCEKGRVAGEQSSRNWGYIRKQGRDPREIPAIIESLRIWENIEKDIEEDIGWHQGGSLYLAETEADLAYYENWLGYARPFQLDSRILTSEEVDDHIGSEGRQWRGALYTPSDGRAEPGKAVPAIARAVERLGGAVLTECAVRTVERASGKVSGVVTEKGEIACQAVVCAGGAWSSLFSGNLGFGFPQLKVRSSVLRTTPAPLVSQSNVSSAGASFRRRQDGGYSIGRSGSGFFDIVPDAFRYFGTYMPALKTQPMRLRLNGQFFKELAWPKRWGPDDVTPFEKTRVNDPDPDMATVRDILATAKRKFPQLGDIEIAEAWSGMIDVTPDVVPVWSGVDGLDGYYIATGFSGHGFGMGAGTGLIMSELITNGTAPVDLTPFRLSRFIDGSSTEIYAKSTYHYWPQPEAA
ncbi:MAG: FAD-binding oxidoreductase [Pseudomonadota bacterium]|nr:FAD-binding oxidoreductase [Pseudomonadota bacterium]